MKSMFPYNFSPCQLPDGGKYHLITFNHCVVNINHAAVNTNQGVVNINGAVVNTNHCVVNINAAAVNTNHAADNINHGVANALLQGFFAVFTFDLKISNYNIN